MLADCLHQRASNYFALDILSKKFHLFRHLPSNLSHAFKKKLFRFVSPFNSFGCFKKSSVVLYESSPGFLRSTDTNCASQNKKERHAFGMKQCNKTRRTKCQAKWISVTVLQQIFQMPFYWKLSKATLYLRSLWCLWVDFPGATLQEILRWWSCEPTQGEIHAQKRDVKWSKTQTLSAEGGRLWSDCGSVIKHRIFCVLYTFIHA